MLSLGQKIRHPKRDVHLLKMHFLPCLLVEILPFLYQVSPSSSLSATTLSATILTFFDPLAHLHFYYYSYCVLCYVLIIILHVCLVNQIVSLLRAGTDQIKPGSLLLFVLQDLAGGWYFINLLAASSALDKIT